MKTLLIFIVNIIVLFYVSCDKPNGIYNEPRRIRGIPVTERELPDETSGFGSLSFLSKVDITSPQDAVIGTLYFREGDYVNSGDIVIILENPFINLAVERAKNNYSQSLAAFNLASSRLLEGKFGAEAQILSLEKAEIELILAERRWEENYRKHLNQETLFLAGGIHTEAILVSRFNIDTEWEQIQLMKRELEIRRIGSRDQDLIRAGKPVPLDETERIEAFISLMTASLNAELEVSYARLEATEKELSSAIIAMEELTIRSSFSGIVGARYFEEGERVRLQDKIITIIDTSSLYAIFPVREREAIRIEQGMKASVFIDGTGETKNGTVDLVYPQADSQSLSFLVRVLLESTKDVVCYLKPGMFVRTTITLGSPIPIVFIPESAIFNQKNGEASVFVINGSNLAERKITLGISYGEEREVKSGLNTGEIIVLRPDSDLREGTHVALME